MSDQLSLMKRNIKLSYFQGFFRSLLFFLPIWYAYEVRFAPIAVLGIIYAFNSLVSVVLELPTGALADLIGRKKTIFLGLILEGIAWIIISQALDVSWLWVGYLLAGISTALVSGADTALNFDSLKIIGGSEDGYAKYASKSGIVIRSAIIIGTFFGGYIYQINPGLPYILVGTSIIFSALIGLGYTEPSIDQIKFSFSSYLQQIKEGVMQLFQTPHTKQLTYYYILIGGITWYFMYFLNQVYATDIGFTSIERGWIFSAIYFVASIILYLIIHLFKLKREYIYLGFPIIMVIGFVPAYFMPKLGTIILLFFIQFAGMGRFTLLDQYTNQEFESRYRATAISALNMGISIFYIVVSSLGGKIIALIGSPAMMSILGIITLIVGFPLAIKLTGEYQKNL